MASLLTVDDVALATSGLDDALDKIVDLDAAIDLSPEIVDVLIEHALEVFESTVAIARGPQPTAAVA